MCFVVQLPNSPSFRFTERKTLRGKSTFAIIILCKYICILALGIANLYSFRHLQGTVHENTFSKTNMLHNTYSDIRYLLMEYIILVDISSFSWIQTNFKIKHSIFVI